MGTSAAKLSAHTVRKVAVLVGCDPRSVLAAVAGRPGRPMLRERIATVLDELGYGEQAEIVRAVSDGWRL